MKDWTCFSLFWYNVLRFKKYQKNKSIKEKLNEKNIFSIVFGNDRIQQNFISSKKNRRKITKVKQNAEKIESETSVDKAEEVKEIKEEKKKNKSQNPFKKESGMGTCMER